MNILQYQDGQLTPLQEPPSETRYWTVQAIKQLKEYFQPAWPELRSDEELADHVLEEFLLVWTGSYLVAVDVVTTWFSEVPVLSEEFIVSFGNHTPYEMVDECLVAVAKQYGCRKVFRGTRSMVGRHEPLARLIQRQGYTVSTIELTKEIA